MSFARLCHRFDGPPGGASVEVWQTVGTHEVVVRRADGSVVQHHPAATLASAMALASQLVQALPHTGSCPDPACELCLTAGVL